MIILNTHIGCDGELVVLLLELGGGGVVPADVHVGGEEHLAVGVDPVKHLGKSVLLTDAFRNLHNQ